jgi:glycosyltransferase involved in cell wall biosynthesis
MKGLFVSRFSTLCYPATTDAKDIAVRFLGVPEEKAKICFLGVDTDMFFPATEENHLNERKELRKQFGFSEQDIVCIYTGRFAEGKHPLCLAKAIHEMSKRGEHYKAIFLGEGPEESEIRNCNHCVVLPFAKFEALPPFYRMADIGVWPRQESTSVLDATACGLPVIISNKVQATERKEGNGITYIENDVDDMIRALLTLKEADVRKKLGRLGINKIMTKLSWKSIAEQRIADYEKALQKNK